MTPDRRKLARRRNWDKGVFMAMSSHCRRALQDDKDVLSRWEITNIRDIKDRIDSMLDLWKRTAKEALEQCEE
jgi:hypothetical protein